MSTNNWFRRLFQGASRPIVRRQDFSKLGVESLEPRQVMAGNVNVAFANNTLTVTGDDAANEFSIVRSGSNLQVTAASGTNLVSAGNYVPYGLKIYSVSDFTQLSIRINSKGGADDIQIGSTNVNNVLNVKSLTIDTGAGADELDINNVRINQTGTSKFTLGTSSQVDADDIDVNGLYVVGGLSVVMGGGNDYFDFDSNTNVMRLLAVDLGAGNDDGYIDWGHYGALNVKLGDGDDYFKTGLESSSFQPVTVYGSVTFDGGNGNNSLVFRHVDFGSTVTIKAGSGNDQVNFEGDLKAAWTTSIDVGQGNNIVTMGKATLQGALSLKSGDGNDIVLFGGPLFVNRKLTLAIKGGNDRVEFGGSTTVNETVDINLGEGNNQLNIEQMWAKTGFKYTGGAGTDNIDIEDGIATPSFFARLGGGNDVLTVDHLAKSQSEYADKIDIDMGAGNDTITATFMYTRDARIKLGAGTDWLYVSIAGISAYAQIDGGSHPTGYGDYGHYFGSYPNIVSNRKITGFELGDTSGYN